MRYEILAFTGMTHKYPFPMSFRLYAGISIWLTEHFYGYTTIVLYFNLIRIALV